MGVRKIAISVPEQVLRQVDRLASRSRTTRSGFITQVLSEVSRASSQAEITERINSLFDEPRVTEEQAETSRAFLRAAEPSDGDSDW